MKLRKLAIAFFFITYSATGSSSDPGLNDQEAVIEIDVTQKHQTIRNFGASDAWTAQYVGKWPDSKRNQVADWLFSKEVDENGQPKGIGLSLWRFNVGAGSAEKDDISDKWRRTEGFLNNDGKTYDWSRQAGERWFLKAAKKRGVEKFVAFSNSPPIQLTKNGKAFSSDGQQANIDPVNYLAFTRFLKDVVKHFKQEEGIAFDYLSPFNEPQWDWTGNGQEGSPYTNQEIFEITRKLDSVIQSEKLPVKIQIGEAGKLNYLYESGDKPARGNQIVEFFDATSPLFLGNLSTVDKVITGHSYFTSAPVETMISVRQNVRAKIENINMPLEFWQSEYCILGDDELVKGGGKDLGIDPALYVARLIHYDLTVANASAWHWWLGVTAYDYKDGLIYVDKNPTDGKVEDTKLLWALGNYSRFIAPGSIRVAVKGTKITLDNPNGLMASSYINYTTKKLITVLVNYGGSAENIKVNVAGAKVDSFKPYITSAGPGHELKPLKAIGKGEVLKVPQRSIITLVGDL